jgi:uncharacterized protein YkwD
MGRSNFARAVLAASLALAVASCVAPRREAPEPPLLVDVAETPAAEPPGPRASSNASLIRAHNARRAKAGLPPLFENSQLDTAAEGHARDMAERRKMSHRGGDGSSPFDRIDRQGYRYRSAGENVAAGFDDVDSVMDGWMKSPGHRRNILGRFTEIGVGRAIAKDGASYWSVSFGTPLGP